MKRKGMGMKKTLFVLLCLIFGSIGFGQEDSHYKAAEELLAVSISAESFDSLIEKTLDQIITANPKIVNKILKAKLDG